MTLASKYKERCQLEADTNGTGLQTTLRCRAQLGQLREQDDSIVHALGQVRLAIPSPALCAVRMSTRVIMAWHCVAGCLQHQQPLNDFQ
jgi:hypothetical protein